MPNNLAAAIAAQATNAFPVPAPGQRFSMQATVPASALNAANYAGAPLVAPAAPLPAPGIPEQYLMPLPAEAPVPGLPEDPTAGVPTGAPVMAEAPTDLGMMPMGVPGMVQNPDGTYSFVEPGDTPEPPKTDAELMARDAKLMPELQEVNQPKVHPDTQRMIQGFFDPKGQYSRGAEAAFGALGFTPEQMAAMAKGDFSDPVLNAQLLSVGEIPSFYGTATPEFAQAKERVTLAKAASQAQQKALDRAARVGLGQNKLYIDMLNTLGNQEYRRQNLTFQHNLFNPKNQISDAQAAEAETQRLAQLMEYHMNTAGYKYDDKSMARMLDALVGESLVNLATADEEAARRYADLAPTVKDKVVTFFKAKFSGKSNTPPAGGGSEPDPEKAATKAKVVAGIREKIKNGKTTPEKALSDKRVTDLSITAADLR